MHRGRDQGAKAPHIAILLFILFPACFSHTLFAADLDSLYRPLIKTNKLLYDGRFNYFWLEEDGLFGSASFEKFSSKPSLYTMGNFIQFALFPFSDVTLGFNETFPSIYKRLTYNPSGALASIQRYQLTSLEDYCVGVRIRKDPVELYFDLLEKRQRSSWTYKAYPDDPLNYFSYIRAHYEDIKVGVRYLSESASTGDRSCLSQVKRPLVGAGQVNVEAELEYVSGRLKRHVYYYRVNRLYNFYHNLKPRLTSQTVLRYGACDNVELEGGVSYTTPFEYEYDYRLFYPDNTSLMTSGTYVLDNNFFIPLALRCRMRRDFEVAASSDLHFINQSLNYSRKNRDGSLNIYPSTALAYFNTQPSISLTYLYDAGKEIRKDDFPSLTKTLLLRHQFLLECRYQRDIAHLNRYLDDNPQNLIDPDNAFLYPLDYFVSGSEYATFFAGNTTNFAANVRPQNFQLVNVNFVYGLSDSVNFGLGYGFHSGSSLHHFTVFDMTSRFYRFKPYHFFDSLIDWRISKGSLLSFGAHFVPEYMTFMENSGYTKEFRSKTRYIDVSVSLKMLF